MTTFLVGCRGPGQHKGQLPKTKRSKTSRRHRKDKRKYKPTEEYSTPTGLKMIGRRPNGHPYYSERYADMPPARAAWKQAKAAKKSDAEIARALAVWEKVKKRRTAAAAAAGVMCRRPNRVNNPTPENPYVDRRGRVYDGRYPPKKPGTLGPLKRKAKYGNVKVAKTPRVKVVAKLRRSWSLSEGQEKLNSCLVGASELKAEFYMKIKQANKMKVHCYGVLQPPAGAVEDDEHSWWYEEH